MTPCTCSPEGGAPQCDRAAGCPAHGKGVCTERETDRLASRLDSGCEWPRQGTLVTARSSGSVERTGKLVDFHVIQTSPGNEYGIAVSTMRRPDWGVYCRHGLKIVEAEPTEHTFQGPRPLCTLGRSDWSHQCSEPRRCPACYPAGRKVQPWPCQEIGCTEVDFERAQEREIEEYWEGINDLMRTQYE